VILVIAEPGDQDAALLVAELAPRPAAAVSIVDFAAAPSCLYHPDFEASTVTVAGRSLPVRDIRAVVNALPAVLPGSLSVYEIEEREYQAAELHAWLSYFLSALSCPVINRPSTLSLGGPARGALGWLHLARAAGIPVAPVAISSDDPSGALAQPAPGRLQVTWAPGMTERTLAEEYTGALARRSGVAFLEAWYAEDDSGNVRFAGARSVPDLASEATRRALLAALDA
jgi:hypothetical protein